MTSNERIVLKCLWDAKGKAHICFISRTTGLTSDYARLLARSLARAGYIKFCDANVCYLLTKGRNRFSVQNGSVPDEQNIDSVVVEEPPEIFAATPVSVPEAVDIEVSLAGNIKSEEPIVKEDELNEDEKEDLTADDLKNEMENESAQNNSSPVNIDEAIEALEAQETDKESEKQGDDEEILEEAIKEESIIEESLPEEAPQDAKEEAEEKIQEGIKEIEEKIEEETEQIEQLEKKAEVQETPPAASSEKSEKAAPKKENPFKKIISWFAEKK